MTRHVLICSANDPLLSSLHHGSGEGGFRLTVCRRGMEAVQTLLTRSFDGLVLDLETPGLESLFLVSIARRIDPTLPIAAISTRPVGPVREVQQKGVGWHLVPPDSTLELAQMIPLRGEDMGGGQHEVLMHLTHVEA
ncbi:MAG: hypothetical protein ACRDFA_01765 [bacterium]